MVPREKGAENKTKGVRGDSGSINRQTNTTTSRSGSRRSARHPHCFTSVMPTALPTSYKGGRTITGNKKPTGKLQLTALDVQEIPGKRKTLSRREQLMQFTPEEVQQSRAGE